MGLSALLINFLTSETLKSNEEKSPFIPTRGAETLRERGREVHGPTSLSLGSNPLFTSCLIPQRT